jgi:farnesyl diphosphate synthase
VTLDQALSESAGLVEAVLDDVLPPADGPVARLYEAMRYSTLGAGKRLRPFLVLAGGRMCGADDRRVLRAGAAVELIHTYSLIHDDLPAMDDDDLRRGKPSCHVAFDEATAILAGDALLTLAFEVLADPATHPDGAVRCDLVRALADAAGGRGMVAGQALDLAGEHTKADLAAITRMERLKTGALIAFSCEAGAIVAGAPADDRAALRAYGVDLGLAFQVVDDLLDVEGVEAAVGKKVGKDAAAGKATFVAALGVRAARAKAQELVDSATARLDRFGASADLFRAVARFVLDRKA